MSTMLQIPAGIDLAAFISQEAHDLKSPFNRSMGFLKLVLKGMDGPIPELAQEDLTVAYQNMQYTLTIMGALVDVSRLERGERQPTLASHPVERLISPAIADWQRKYHKNNQVELTYNAPSVSVMADEIMFRQCLAYWMLYVNEFVESEAAIHLEVEESEAACLFTIRSSGKTRAAPECDLTLFGFAARGILALHHGDLRTLESYEQGAVVQFTVPKE